LWFSKEETMPEESWQFFYECKNCKTVLKPKQGDCCVYCSSGTVPCRSNKDIQNVANFVIPMNKEIDKKLKARNIKPTAMRELVLQVLTDQPTAISLPELEQKFEKADKATLYRTLKTFQEYRLIHAIEDGTGSVKYALCEDTCSCNPDDLHLHFLCTKCGKTYCLVDTPIKRPDLPEGFEFDNANFVVKGSCSNCLA
jgi:Fur family ferric uptake transcriptional regulator